MALAVAGLMAALSSMVLLVDLLENLRFAGKVGAGFGLALRLTLLRTPAMAQSMLPFVFLFGALWMFSQLNRRSELVVMRSAGLSVWRLIGPAALFALLAGVLAVVAIDPLSARMMAAAEKAKLESRGQRASLARVFGDGIWLRQRDNGELLIINAASFDAERGALQTVTVWRMAADGAFEERIDAPEAALSGRTLEMKEARMKAAGMRFPQKTPVYSIPTSLTLADLRETLPPPESMSVFDLPRFMRLAEAAGLPTVRYSIRFHDLCSTPLKLTAMVLIAAIFSVRPIRSGGTARLLLASVGSGFGLYILSEVSTALGESGSAAPPVAAWTPAVVATIVALSLLMRHEES